MRIIYMLLFAISLTPTIGFTNSNINFDQQNNFTLNPNQTEKSLNNALVQLAEGINPKSFNKSWKTEGPAWLDKVKAASDIPTLSISYLMLAENIKPKLFKPSWEKSKEKWVKQVKEARSSLALAGLLKSFYNHLLPETFTKDWSSIGSQWVEMLSNIE